MINQFARIVVKPVRYNLKIIRQILKMIMIAVTRYRYFNFFFNFAGIVIKYQSLKK